MADMVETESPKGREGESKREVYRGEYRRGFLWYGHVSGEVESAIDAKAFMGVICGVSASFLFETDRLWIRQIDMADEPAMFAVYSDPVGARFVDDGLPIERDEVGPWIVKTRENYRSYGYGMSVIMERASDAAVGFIGLVHPGGQVEPEVKYSLRRESWGHGFASEALTGMVAYGQREHGLREIIATVDPAHLASQHVLTKCGFSLREDRSNDDGSITHVFVLKQDA
ncbi:GNAT family N-acetyltransferase [Opitutaceae bacterium]|nr:GNAT family N-acetyltransferase [Opitutaceae bacterium]